MATSANTFVIGFTGSFGSGCSTSAGLLADAKLKLLGTPAVRHVRLSDVVKTEWRSKNAKKEASREDLQATGDEIRNKHGNQELAKRAINEIQKLKSVFQFVFVDGIRNTGEISWLRQEFSDHFYLVAIDAPAPLRWTRSQAAYHKLGLSESEFHKDDARDLGEETAYGQQVQLCVDQADVIIVNDETYTKVQLNKRLGGKLSEYVSLLAGKTSRYPNPDETIMNMAYAASHSTKCLKRQVGAVITSAEGDVVGIGFNENPSGTLPCIDQYGECYRDIVRNEYLEELATNGAKCPGCGEAIAATVGPPWRCGCGEKLAERFFPGRAMLWCTALHAEERAILNARGQNLRGATVYTSTFPCFLCAEKIAHAGIKKVVFMEPYPDIRAAGRLEVSKIAVERFEGVRSSAFDRIFARARQDAEDSVEKARLTKSR